ncbi:sodium/proton antiporter NhaB [Pseudomonas sp. F1_0610]|uniref:sodium/proton antiporter NhaB n=1 Tax=Pseudomonas sp. F1_0610 TaxID=3114284 RepID=UPI0039C2D4B8
MLTSFASSFGRNFLGNSPNWYKQAIIIFLLINPAVLIAFGAKTASWLLVAEFIFTLAMALKCYPLQAGGLLVVEAILMQLATPDAVYKELVHNFPVLLLLIFMVTGIHFLQDLLLAVFSKVLLGIRSKTLLSVIFCALAAFLSAFLDALTVTAVVISVAVGFYSVYHKVASGKRANENDPNISSDNEIPALDREHLEEFRAFLRSLLMHAAVGTALGGVATLVGEPQNLLIGKQMGWDFGTFFLHMMPVSIPVLAAGLITCVILERTHWFGYGAKLPKPVRQVLADFAQSQAKNRTAQQVAALWVQASAALILIIGLAFHIAEVGLIGLLVIILVSALNGITAEHRIGNAFQDAMPFTALLVVFFAVVAVIQEQHLFTPIIHWVLSLPTDQQPSMLYIANGLLSAISDNVFVATIYITEVEKAFAAGSMTREHFEWLAISINAGTNLPSVATPNGQAAFLFLLTSAIAPLVRLSYGRMVWMALPYTVIMGLLGWFAVSHWA